MEIKNLIKIGYLLTIILVIALIFIENKDFSDSNDDIFTISNYIDNPEKYGGVQLENFGRIVEINQDHFYFDIGSMDLKVYGTEIKKPILGEIVVYIDYNKNGKMEMIDYHTYDYNYVLYGLSFFSLIVFVIIFFAEWKITRRGFEDA